MLYIFLSALTATYEKKTQIDFYLLLGIQFSGVVDFDSLNNSPYYIIKLGLGKWKC